MLIFIGYGSWNFSLGTALDCWAANVQSMSFRLCTPGRGNCCVILRIRHVSAVLQFKIHQTSSFVSLHQRPGQISTDVRLKVLRNAGMSSDYWDRRSTVFLASRYLPVATDLNLAPECVTQEQEDLQQICPKWQKGYVFIPWKIRVSTSLFVMSTEVFNYRSNTFMK